MTRAYKLLDKIPCVQPEMSMPFGYYGGAAPVAERPAAPVNVTRL